MSQTPGQGRAETRDGSHAHLAVHALRGLRRERQQRTTPFVATFESAACEMPLPEGQDPANVTCGWLTVPENRSHPEGRTIKLAVVTLAATGTNPEPDPLVILSGGPGQWAIDSVLPMFSGDFAAPIQSQRDIVIFDQRGSGRSQPALNCPEVSSYRDALGVLTTTEQDAEIDAQIFRDCRDRLVREGNDLSGYSSAATAQDIDDLMTALGYDRFNLYGLSYGTRVALTALRDLPAARIRSVVLDSVVPLQASGVRTGSAVERSFDRLLADCAADPACDRAYPNLRQTTFDLIDQFNREPLIAHTDRSGHQPAVPGDHHRRSSHPPRRVRVPERRADPIPADLRYHHRGRQHGPAHRGAGAGRGAGAVLAGCAERRALQRGNAAHRSGRRRPGARAGEPDPSPTRSRIPTR